MGDDVEAVLVELAGVTGDLGALRDRQDTLVARARVVGATWAHIADALGVTVQAAHKRYRGVGSDRHGQAWHDRQLPL